MSNKKTEEQDSEEMEEGGIKKKGEIESTELTEDELDEASGGQKLAYPISNTLKQAYPVSNTLKQAYPISNALKQPDPIANGLKAYPIGITIKQ